MGASEKDLAGLDCQYKPNPHYPSRYPMRLYLLREVEVSMRACMQCAMSGMSACCNALRCCDVHTMRAPARLHCVLCWLHKMCV